MAFPFGETITQIKREATGQTDPDGNDVLTETPVQIENVGISPRDANGTGGNENVQGRDTVIIGLTLLMPPGSQVSPTDRFLVRGDLWEVYGQPEPIVSPFTGWNPGLPVAIGRVTG